MTSNEFLALQIHHISQNHHYFLESILIFPFVLCCVMIMMTNITCLVVSAMFLQYLILPKEPIKQIISLFSSYKFYVFINVEGRVREKGN